MLKKPQSVASSPFKSAKWDEITAGRNYRESDAPTIALLCSWYEVVDKCMSDIDIGGEVQVAYSNDLGDIKALPQLSTMKQASAEIRALNKQLGINDGRDTPEYGNTPLQIVIGRRKDARRSATA